MGCILRDFEYEEPPNLPPSVHGTTETPFDTVYVVDLEQTPGGDGGAPSNLTFLAEVRDANVGDQLTGIVFVDRTELDPRADLGEINIPAEQDQDPRRRLVRIDLDRTEITTPGCHSVELHVSRAFQRLIEGPIPVDPEDFGAGTWWIAAIDSGTTTVDMRACPRVRDM